MLFLVNLISLAFIAYIDYMSYKIPNVVLCGWLLTSLYYYVFNSIVPCEVLVSHLLASILVAGSFIPIRHIVKCNAGDFKLFGMLVVTNGLEDTLWIILITLSFSMFTFAGGVKKVPIGFLSFFGYVAFLFFRKDGIL